MAPRLGVSRLGGVWERIGVGTYGSNVPLA
jgi:hypothetical protein